MKMRTFSIIALLTAMTAPAAAQTATDLLEQGREAYLNYDFSEAARLYAAAKKKVKRTDTDFTEKYTGYQKQLTMAQNFLDRVEKISIIDSITVSKPEFFKAYRIPASSGHLQGSEAMPVKGHTATYIFSNENQDYKIWAERDTIGDMRLIEASRLNDGSWGEPTFLDDQLFANGDQAYPFMMADGVTLYYADNGDNSLGGYDIMVATRDAGDGSFLQPQNMGFPYNSPYDDYLLAIDELNGVGWWATDRNQLDDELTIYVFVTNDLRQNYSADDDDVESFARIDDYIATQPEDADYTELLNTIRAIDPNESAREADFYLPMPGGKSYTSYDDFRSSQARTMMRQYVAAQAEYKENAEKLQDMRVAYHESRSIALGKKIAGAETALARELEQLQKMQSDIYKLELKN
jgi:hypothetical protein